jgi:hypothetical protein
MRDCPAHDNFYSFNAAFLKTAEACGALELDAELWQIDRGARLHMARRRLR